MDEEEFDALMPARPFGHEDFLRTEAAARRQNALGIALWGRIAAGLERQLLRPVPEIPSGFEVADFHELLRNTLKFAAMANDPRFAQLARSFLASSTVVIGTERFTAWEARCAILRRAIEYLETH